MLYSIVKYNAFCKSIHAKKKYIFAIKIKLENQIKTARLGKTSPSNQNAFPSLQHKKKRYLFDAHFI